MPTSPEAPAPRPTRSRSRQCWPQPWADVVLSDAATVEAVKSNLAALELELDPELLERLNGVHIDPVTYWRTRAELPWN